MGAVTDGWSQWRNRLPRITTIRSSRFFRESEKEKEMMPRATSERAAVRRANRHHTATHRPRAVSGSPGLSQALGDRVGDFAKAACGARVLTRTKRTGIVRLALWLPAYLYSANLGWLLGHRFLLLTHRGRRSRRARRTVLEVLHYDPVTRESLVVSAWGEDSDRYRK
jgi:hypothetical protein